MGPKRGRHRGCRWITAYPETNLYRPYGIPPIEMRTITLTLTELEALRLVDYEGLDQETAALRMGVSRKTLWLELKSGRKKVASALINGWAIRIEGGNYILRGEIR